jgi:hypothetical protein
MMETQIQTLVKEREERQKAQAAAAVVQQQQNHVTQQQQQSHVAQQQQSHVSGTAPPQIFTETIPEALDVTVNSKLFWASFVIKRLLMQLIISKYHNCSCPLFRNQLFCVKKDVALNTGEIQKPDKLYFIMLKHFLVVTLSVFRFRLYSEPYCLVFGCLSNTGFRIGWMVLNPVFE